MFDFPLADRYRSLSKTILLSSRWTESSSTSAKSGRFVDFFFFFFFPFFFKRNVKSELKGVVGIVLVEEAEEDAARFAEREIGKADRNDCTTCTVVYVCTSRDAPLNLIPRLRACLARSSLMLDQAPLIAPERCRRSRQMNRRWKRFINNALTLLFTENWSLIYIYTP